MHWADIVDGLLFRQQKPTYDSTEYSQLDELSNLLIGSCFKEQYKKGDYPAYDQLIDSDFKPANCADNTLTYQKKLAQGNVRKIDHLLLSIGGNDGGFCSHNDVGIISKYKRQFAAQCGIR